MRAVLSTILGFCLISLWSVAIVGRESMWLAWMDLGAGVVAVVAAFGFVRERSRARLSMALNGLILLAGSVLAVALGIPRWLSWTSLALACGALMFGVPGRLGWPHRARPPVAL